MTAHVMPHAPEAERAVLGALLLAPRRVLDECRVLVDADDFYMPAHGAIWRAACELDAAGSPVDPATLDDALRIEIPGQPAAHALMNRGGALYFSELMNEVVTVENVAFHARMIRGKANVRRMIVAAHEIAAAGMGEYGDPAEYLADAERRVLEITGRAQPDGYRHMRDVMRETVATVEKRYNRKQAITGVPTGIESLDAMTGGLQPGHLVIIAGRAKQGKTAFVMSCARHAATGANALQTAFPVLVVSLEMAAGELGERLTASEGSVDSVKLRNGFLERLDWINFSRAATVLAGAPIHVYARPATFAQIRSLARRWRARETRPDQLGLLIVDYVGLVQPDKGGGRRNRQEEIAAWSRGFKELAIELGVPVALLAQLNRGVESRADKRPTMADLRESGALEQDADIVGLVYREGFYDKNADPAKSELIIDGNRHGPTGTIPLRFDGAYVRFTEA